jgi:ribosomal protein S18 acetylase RimI-like enzyme
MCLPQLRMLLFPRERMDVGAALVAGVTEWMRPRGRRLLALSCELGYPMYRGLWLGGEPMGTALLPHVQVALEVGGFKTTQESIFLVARLDGPPAEAGTKGPIELADSPAEMVSPAMADSWKGFEPWTVRATLGGQKVAEIGWVVLEHVARRLGAPVLNIWSLGVQEAHRRKGFASALVARALRAGYRRGARFASLGTQLWNAPAQGTYARFGFHPYCVLTARAMDVPEPAAGGAAGAAQAPGGRS